MSMGVPGREGLEQTAQPQFKVGDRVEINESCLLENHIGEKGYIIEDIGDAFGVSLDGYQPIITFLKSSLKLLPEEQMVDSWPLIKELMMAVGSTKLSAAGGWPIAQSQFRAILAPYMEGSDE